MPPVSRTLWLGDALALTAVSVLGFAFHNTLTSANIPRLVWSIVTVVLAWTLAAWPTAALDANRMRHAREWWRLLWAALLAVPLALALYEFPRGRVITWAFTRALGTFALAALVGWRVVHWGLAGRRAARA